MRKKRLTIKDLIFKILLLFMFSIISLYSLLLNHSVFAASPSPSPNKALNEFAQKVDDIKKDAASKAAELKTQVSKTIQNKAYIGKVLEVKDKQIIIQAAKGPRTINTDEYTAFTDTAKRGFVFKDIKKDDFLTALGDVDDKQNLKAKRIIRTKQPTPSERYVVWGETQSVILGTITLLKPDNQKISIKTDDKTLYRLGSDDATFSDVKTGNFIISVGNTPTNNSTTAKFIYLLDLKGDLKIVKNASASATPSASPKKTP